MLAFHDQFLGPNNVYHIQKQAEHKLLYLLYQVERKKCTFERFVTTHKDQLTILEGLTDHGYCGLDARTKVNFLLNRIKADSLGAVKANTMQDSKLFIDFERCVTFYKDFIKKVQRESELKTKKGF